EQEVANVRADLDPFGRLHHPIEIGDACLHLVEADVVTGHPYALVGLVFGLLPSLLALLRDPAAFLPDALLALLRAECPVICQIVVREILLLRLDKVRVLVLPLSGRRASRRLPALAEFLVFALEMANPFLHPGGAGALAMLAGGFAFLAFALAV